MPHLVLEYSSNLSQKKHLEQLFPLLHQTVALISSANLESCKTRVIEQTSYYIGDGQTSNAFVHLEIRLAEGRTLLVKKDLGEKMLEILRLHFSNSLKDFHLQITVEVKEFQKNLYFKIPSGSV